MERISVLLIIIVIVMSSLLVFNNYYEYVKYFSQVFAFMPYLIIYKGKHFQYHIFLISMERFETNNDQNIDVLSGETSKYTSCSIYPDISKITFSNTYWQIFTNNGLIFHLYGAYFGRILKSSFKIYSIS